MKAYLIIAGIILVLIVLVFLFGKLYFSTRKKKKELEKQKQGLEKNAEKLVKHAETIAEIESEKAEVNLTGVILCSDFLLKKKWTPRQHMRSGIGLRKKRIGSSTTFTPTEWMLSGRSTRRSSLYSPTSKKNWNFSLVITTIRVNSFSSIFLFP